MIFDNLIGYSCDVATVEMVPLGCSPASNPCFSPEPSSALAFSLRVKSTGDGGGVLENFDARSKI